MSNTLTVQLNDQFVEHYWVYSVRGQSSDRIEFMWVGKLKEIFTFQHIRSNKFYNSREIYEVEIYKNYHYDSKFEALRALDIVIKQACPEYSPRMNLYHKGYTNDRIIICVDTGEEFRSAADVCRKYDINPGQLSAHLLNKIGYKTVKGKRFVYKEVYLRNLEITRKLMQLTKNWVPAMFTISPFKWNEFNTGLDKDTVQKLFFEYMKSEFKHPLDNNLDDDTRIMIPMTPTIPIDNVDKQ